MRKRKMKEPRGFLITKHFEPEGEYKDSLDELSHPFEENLTPDLDAIVKFRYLEDDEIAEVKSRPHIISVREDKPVSLIEPDTKKVPHISTTTTDLDPDALWYMQLGKAAAAGKKGKDVAVAILDTGVRSDILQNVFAGRVKATKSFVDGQGVEDGNGHGTFCCVAATPDESELVVGKVLSNEGSGYDSWIVAGINWAVAAGAKVISMSLGADDTDSSPYDATLKAAKDAGVMVFCAAGNSGNDHPVNIPGRSEYAYAVAAMDDHSGRVVNFSCTGPEVDFAAVGYQVYFEGRNWSGTSMATPLCADVYATILAEAKDPVVAMKAMVSTCYDLVDDPPTFDGVGVPQAMNAIASLPGVPKPPISLPEVSYLKVPSTKQKCYLVGGTLKKKRYGIFTPEGMQ